MEILPIHELPLNHVGFEAETKRPVYKLTGQIPGPQVALSIEHHGFYCHEATLTTGDVIPMAYVKHHRL